MALPMYFFYEVGIISAGFFKKPKTEGEAETQEVAGVSSSPNDTLNPKTAAAGGDDDYVGVP